MADRLRIGACLSLTGRFAQFGSQAALGLEAWQSLDGAADVIVEDDRSDRHTLEALLPDVAARCDVLLGPYSTILMRAAGRIAADSGRLIWNHGGSGDDVERAHPGHVGQACRHAELSIQCSESLYVRSLSFCRTVLATGHLLNGELDQATALAAAVVDTAADQVRSRRVLAYLDDFRERLSRHPDAKPAREFGEYVAARLVPRKPDVGAAGTGR